MDTAYKRVVWQGASWRLRVTAGHDPPRGLVEHPGSVVLVAVADPGPRGSTTEILMLRQYRPSLAQTILELPAGTRGWDEDWAVCAQRELREETGFRAADFRPLGRIWPAPGLSDEVMAIYLALSLTPDPLPADEDEVFEVVSYPLEELLAMGRDGRLADAKSVVALYRAAYALSASGSAAGASSPSSPSF